MSVKMLLMASVSAATPAPIRPRHADDPWTLVLRMIHDLGRDGIAVMHPERIGQAVPLVAQAMEVLGVSARIPAED